MLLKDNQEKELFGAILEFLEKKNLNITAESLKTEIGEINKSTDDTLERKWTAVFRLQKKIFDLEDQVKNLKSELEVASEFKKKGWTENKNTLGIPNTIPKYTLKGHKDIINSICFHPIYSAIISGSNDSTIKIWDFDLGKLEKTLTGHTYSVNDVTVNSNGSLIASASSDQTIKIWDFQEKVCLKTLIGHDHIVSSIKFHLNGDDLLSVSRDKTLKIWDLNTGYCKTSLNEHDNWPRCLDINENGTLAASGGHDELIIIWDLIKKESIGLLAGHTHVIESVTFVKYKESNEFIENSNYNKSKGDYLISGSRDKNIRIWDIKTFDSIHTFKGHDEWVKSCKILTNRKLILSVGEDNTMIVWDLETGLMVKKFSKVHNNFISSLDIHNEFMVLATGSVDKSIKIWEIL